MGITT